MNTNHDDIAGMLRAIVIILLLGGGMIGGLLVSNLNQRLDYHRDTLCALAARHEISIAPEDCAGESAVRIREEIRRLQEQLEKAR